MMISKKARDALRNVDSPLYEALLEIQTALQVEWSGRGFKKETEFETLWSVAELEGRRRGVLDFIDVVYNPNKYAKSDKE